jgi:hypothetical protein
MGVGLSLTGRYAENPNGAEDWLEGVVSWIERHAGEPLERVRLGRDGEENPAVLASLHPGAEDVEIAVPEPGRVVVSAKTSTVGPGYHAFLCDLLHRLGDAMDIFWDEPGPGDESGYFHSGDWRGLEKEFLGWLRGVVTVIADGLEDDYQWLMISMAIGHHYHHHGPLVTPMGPRDLRWLGAVAEDPRRGIDLFSWWPAGTGAPFHLGRALTRMWRDVRWREPTNDDEGRLLMDVHLDLARAFRLDPSLDYPWREWRELMGYIEAHFGYLETDGGEVDLEAEVGRRAAAIDPAASPLIGYRRRPVRVDLTDGWSIEIPGEMAEEWDEEGLWTASDAGRAVFFKSYGLSTEDGGHPAAREILGSLSLPEGRRLRPADEGPLGQAVLAAQEPAEDGAWQLTAHSAIDGGLAVCNILFRDPAERDWAIATWRTLRHS